MSDNRVSASDTMPVEDSMRAVVLHSPKDLRLEIRPIPVPAPDEVLIAVKSVGVCGSDVHYWRSGRIGDFVVRSPMILGHECAGEVISVGSAVVSLRAGDRVALEAGIPCRRCPNCRAGRYNLCPDVVFMATPPVDGAFTEFLVHPADFAYRLPSNVSFDEGALLEPLSVGIHAVERAGIGLGASVLITGSGPIGLCALLAARAAGAACILVTDRLTDRLKLARSLGATAMADSAIEDVARVALNMTDSFGMDAVVECSGSSAAASAAFEALKPGGTFVAVGTGADTLTVPMPPFMNRELNVRGVFRYANTYPKAIALLGTGQVDLKPLITHHFSLEEVEKAMNVAHASDAGAIKVMVHP